MEGGAVGYNFERDPPRDHPCQVWFNSVQRFQRRRFKKKREKTQIKGWIELSSLVNRTGSTLSTSVLSFKLIAWIVIEKF